MPYAVCHMHICSMGCGVRYHSCFFIYILICCGRSIFVFWLSVHSIYRKLVILLLVFLKASPIFHVRKPICSKVCFLKGFFFQRKGWLLKMCALNIYSNSRCKKKRKRKRGCLISVQSTKHDENIERIWKTFEMKGDIKGSPPTREDAITCNCPTYTCHVRKKREERKCHLTRKERECHLSRKERVPFVLERESAIRFEDKKCHLSRRERKCHSFWR